MRPHMRQAVTITGLGNTVFDHCLHNMEKAYLAFANHFPANRLDQWEPTRLGNYIALDAHTRYFSQKHFVPSTESLPFHHTVDPEGVLESMRGDDLVHAADNDVDYFSQYTEKDGQILWVIDTTIIQQLTKIIDINAPVQWTIELVIL